MSASYQLNSSRVSLREYSWGTPWLLWPLVLPLLLLLKLFRVRLPGSTDDPCFESISEFQVPAEQIPDAVQIRFAPMIAELGQMGFHSLIFHRIEDPRHLTTIYWVHLLHQSGRVVARLHNRIWNGAKPPREYFFPAFLSQFADGTFLVTSAGKPDLMAPGSVQMLRMPESNLRHLWESHRRELDQKVLTKSVVAVQTHQEMSDLVERLHAVTREFHVARGVFDVAIAADETFVATTSGVLVQSTSFKHADVLVELELLQRRRVSWVNMLLVFMVSIALFLGAGFKDHRWQLLLLLVGVLFIHEMGHYVAMRVFGYRNMRMFFIPFFGAAVTGQNYNVAGWKKAIVSLMGPVPGIMLGIIVGTIGLATDHESVVKAGIVLLGLNGFNLLPVLPLDGGWVLHATLFCRHPLLDVGFKLIAALTLLAAGIFGFGRLLIYVAIVLLLGLPGAYRVARIAATLRRRGISLASNDATTIPAETAQVIIEEVRSAFPPSLNARLAAHYTTQIFETLNARPPHWTATIALLGIHGFSFVIALFGSAFFYVQQAHPRDAAAEINLPAHEYRSGTSQVWSGTEAEGLDGAKAITVVGEFADSSKASATYRSLIKDRPGKLAVAHFGSSILLSVPDSEPQLAKQYAVKLENSGGDTTTYSPEWPVIVRISAVATDEVSAKRIKEQFDAYTTVPQFVHLIPPWHPKNEQAPDEWAKFAKNRQAFLQIIKDVEAASGDHRCRKAMKRYLAAMSKEDLPEIEAASRERSQVLHEVRQERLSQRRNESTDQSEVELLDLYLDLQRAKATTPNKKHPKWDAIGERLGRFPSVDGELKPGTNRYCVKSGTATQVSRRIDLDWLQPCNPVATMPAIADWLLRNQCRNMRYEITALHDETEQNE